MNLNQSLLLEEKSLSFVIDTFVTPDQYANSVCIGPTKWFLVEQQSKSKMIPTVEAKLIKQWKEIDLRQYHHEQRGFGF